ncbi:pyridoxamine 5'-phosphate oxidase family protein [Candidatus Nitrosotenuis chungbukensis]|uniref:pyridoxamine 5'-phosphate oxidase family protein n=1 Tax=Candidatus Nitrosotenuis chungbukensis TaxID=1353246 RepID=UPI002671C9A0|nr:pyridoxamine 5'-phosphate oxidase family protein [Candidatus Nitrosotenuis chungbukensis]WKT57603.1 pyridoxamine 5'-phosphate oxidase family protein [Candidatus Nitrosotenuis chungbukensis]
MPHVKPVSFIFQDNSFYIATDYTTVTYKNIKKNQHAAITVDIYDPAQAQGSTCAGRSKDNRRRARI